MTLKDKLRVVVLDETIHRELHMLRMVLGITSAKDTIRFLIDEHRAHASHTQQPMKDALPDASEKDDLFA